MCGISGIINKNDCKVSRGEIKKINDLIIHRGPDDEGYYFGENFAFGHRRLAILDLSDAGHQPMEYKGRYGEYVITYNGEIYNYVELRNELIKEGYKFKSNTDTEVILACYDKWGEDCVNRFNGMWAFAIYDKKRGIIFCSRDRFGIKPFYYTEVGKKFVFGSEIKQLLEYYPKRYVNKKILMDYLVVGLEEHTDETFFENIYKLGQSHNLIYNLKTHTYQIKKYYDINIDKDIKKLNLQESVDLFKNKFINSIKLRLRSDVKVGTCLSGGLDSSSIAAIASREYQKQSNKKFTAIHAKSIENATDESSYAKKVAEYCDIDLKIVEPSTEDFLKYLDEVIYTQEEPFGGASIFMQYFVFKKAKETGCKVMLDGQGGDETLLGYERYYPAYLISLDIINAIKSFFFTVKNSKLSVKELAAYIIYFTNSKIRIKRLKSKHSYIKKEYFNLINKKILEEISKKYLQIRELQYYEIYKTQLPHLLKYEDKNSMIHSIETRLPFIDYQTMETALSLNNNFKISKGWTKYILRKVVNNYLPYNVVWRKNKFGFESPAKKWLSRLDDNIIKHSKIINEIVDMIDLNNLDILSKWKLFNIARWEKIYNVEIS